MGNSCNGMWIEDSQHARKDSEKFVKRYQWNLPFLPTLLKMWIFHLPSKLFHRWWKFHNYGLHTKQYGNRSDSAWYAGDNKKRLPHIFTSIGK